MLITPTMAQQIKTWYFILDGVKEFVLDKEYNIRDVEPKDNLRGAKLYELKDCPRHLMSYNNRIYKITYETAVYVNNDWVVDYKVKNIELCESAFDLNLCFSKSKDCMYITVQDEGGIYPKSIGDIQAY